MENLTTLEPLKKRLDFDCDDPTSPEPSKASEGQYDGYKFDDARDCYKMSTGEVDGGNMEQDIMITSPVVVNAANTQRRSYKNICQPLEGQNNTISELRMTKVSSYKEDVMLTSSRRWIAQLHHSFQDNDLFLVVDFHSDVDLHSLINRHDGILDESMLPLCSMAEMSVAIKSIHLTRYVHRSLASPSRPENSRLSSRLLEEELDMKVQQLRRAEEFKDQKVVGSLNSGNNKNNKEKMMPEQLEDVKLKQTYLTKTKAIVEKMKHTVEKMKYAVENITAVEESLWNKHNDSCSAQLAMEKKLKSSENQRMILEKELKQKIQDYEELKERNKVLELEIKNLTEVKKRETELTFEHDNGNLQCQTLELTTKLSPGVMLPRMPRLLMIWLFFMMCTSRAEASHSVEQNEVYFWITVVAVIIFLPFQLYLFFGPRHSLSTPSNSHPQNIIEPSDLHPPAKPSNSHPQNIIEPSDLHPPVKPSNSHPQNIIEPSDLHPPVKPSNSPLDPCKTDSAKFNSQINLLVLQNFDNRKPDHKGRASDLFEENFGDFKVMIRKIERKFSYRANREMTNHLKTNHLPNIVPVLGNLRLSEFMLIIFPFYSLNFEIFVNNWTKDLYEVLKEMNQLATKKYTDELGFQTKLGKDERSNQLEAAKSRLIQLINKINRILLQIINGVTSLHNINMIHADLVSKHILIQEKGNNISVALANLRRSRSNGENNIFRRQINTSSPSGVAPEIEEGFKNFSKESDIFSVGQIAKKCWQSIENLIPQDNAGILAANCLSSIENIKKNITQATKRMLHENPGKRPTAKQASCLPVFWKRGSLPYFFEKVYIYLKRNNSQLITVDSSNKDIPKKELCWIGKYKNKAFFAHMMKYASYDDSPKSFVHFVRNLEIHRHQIPHCPATTPQELEDFVMHSHSELFYYIYDYSHSTSELVMDEFYRGNLIYNE